MNDPQNPEDRPDSDERPPGPWGALEAADRKFPPDASERSTGRGRGAESVLDHIERVTGESARVSLQDAASAGDTPLLTPLVPGRPPEAGKYVVQGELGRGGVGAVHKGYDQDLGRDVAMKFLHERYGKEPTVLHRFVEEAQIGGQLQHPGIVPVYDLGMYEGRPFFTMKLVKGETLAKKLAHRTSPADRRPEFIAIFEDVCQTMAYAHARGVVHRDLKPANIMIGSFGEVQVVDWGMGKVRRQGGVADERAAADRREEQTVVATVRSQGHGSQSIVGSVMGTPAYMPPEQARGDVEAMDERSDVFALGAILCEILTGAPPYVGEPARLIAMAAMAKLDDAMARLDACDAEADLIDLARSCLMPARAARPASAQDVAQVVHDHLAQAEARVHDARVEAAEARVKAASLRRMQRLGIAFTTVIAAALCVSLWFGRAASRAADQAEAELARATEIKRVLASTLQGVAPELAQGSDTRLLRGLLDATAARLDRGGVASDRVETELRSIVGSTYRSIGALDQADRQLDAAMSGLDADADPRDALRIEVLGALGTLRVDQGRHAEAEKLLHETLTRSLEINGEAHLDTLVARLNLANAYKMQARYADAESGCREAGDGLERLMGEDHPLTLAARVALADVRVTQQDLAEAEDLFRRTIAIQERLLGPRHPHVLLTREKLAHLLGDRGQSEEALALLESILDDCRQVLGERHPTTLAAVQNLAAHYCERGQYTKAEPMQRDALRIVRETLGDAHPQTVAASDGLAITLARLGRFAEAEALHVEARRLATEVYGPGHPSTLNTTVNLANLYCLMGRYAEAAELFESSLGARAEALSEDLPFVVNAAHGLAVAYQQLGRTAEAEKLLQGVIERRSRVFGPDNPPLLEVLADLGELQVGAGRYLEARSVLEPDLPRLRRILGAAHPRTLGAMNSLATAYVALGRQDEGLALQREALELRREKQGAEHRETLGATTNLGLAYLNAGRPAEAVPVLEASVAAKRRVLGEQDAFTFTAIQNLARAYRALGRFEDALPLHEEMIAIREATLGARDGETLVATSNLADCLNLMGRFAQAAERLAPTLTTMREVLGDDHPYTLLAMGNLARACTMSDRFADAERLYLELRERRLSGDGPEHPQTLAVTTNLGDLYGRMGRFADAAQMLEISLPLSRRILGLRHRETGIAMRLLGLAYVKLGRDDEAESVLREILALDVERAEAPGSPAAASHLVAIAYLSIPVPSLRDPQRAVVFAKRACEKDEAAGGKNRGRYQRVLATALFRAGDVAGAVAAQREALAHTSGADAAKAREDLATYEQALGER